MRVCCWFLFLVLFGFCAAFFGPDTRRYPIPILTTKINGCIWNMAFASPTTGLSGKQTSGSKIPSGHKHKFPKHNILPDHFSETQFQTRCVQDVIEQEVPLQHVPRIRRKHITKWNNKRQHIPWEDSKGAVPMQKVPKLKFVNEMAIKGPGKQPEEKVWEPKAPRGPERPFWNPNRNLLLTAAAGGCWLQETNSQTPFSKHTRNGKTPPNFLPKRTRNQSQ